jgi:Holliday junction DNA helicase RuvA
MIALLRGEIAERGGDHLTVMCAGVGYRLSVSAQTLAAAGPIGGEATLHTHLIVRDDALVLVGFATAAERDLFLELLGVQAVGPKLALAVLGAGPLSEVAAAIATGDTRFFQAVPGVGKRTAERIIVELRDKVGAELGEGIMLRRATAGEGPRELARDGLLELGFLAAALRASRQGAQL